MVARCASDKFSVLIGVTTVLNSTTGQNVFCKLWHAGLQTQRFLRPAGMIFFLWWIKKKKKIPRPFCLQTLVRAASVVLSPKCWKQISRFVNGIYVFRPLLPDGVQRNVILYIIAGRQPNEFSELFSCARFQCGWFLH